MFSKLILVTALASAVFGASNHPSEAGDDRQASSTQTSGSPSETPTPPAGSASPAPSLRPATRSAIRHTLGAPASARTGSTSTRPSSTSRSSSHDSRSISIYAVGGVTINGTLVPPTITTKSLIKQVVHFEKQVSKKPTTAPWTSENALFSVWIGINDINNSYYKRGDRNAFSDKLLHYYFEQVQRLYDAGARNFLFINVPPIYRTPHMLKKSASARALQKSIVTGYNSKLAAKVKAFAAKYPGVKTHIWDANTAFNDVLNAVKQNGFTDATSYGKTGDFWANDFHPSSKAHHIWAKDVAAVLKDTIWL